MSNKKPNILLSAKNDLTMEDIEYYFSNPDIQKIRKLVNERNFNVNDTDITYRMIGHWDQHDLLPIGLRENSGWRKFTFIEMVWLRIIQHLREFGLSLDKIVYVKECIMEFNEKTNTYDSFEYFVIQSWKSSSNPCLMVAYNGHAEIATLKDLSNMANLIGQNDMILISLSTIVEEVGFKTMEKSELFDLKDEHKELLSEIQSDSDKEIKIKVNKGKMVEMESTSNMTALMAGEIRKQIKDQGLYGNISIPFEEGIPQLVRVTKRKRFKK
jgi:DNA-binding transcriptional MerR regulator